MLTVFSGYPELSKCMYLPKNRFNFKHAGCVSEYVRKMVISILGSHVISRIERWLTSPEEIMSRGADASKGLFPETKFKLGTTKLNRGRLKSVAASQHMTSEQQWS